MIITKENYRSLIGEDVTFCGETVRISDAVWANDMTTPRFNFSEGVIGKRGRLVYGAYADEIMPSSSWINKQTFKAVTSPVMLRDYADIPSVSAIKEKDPTTAPQAPFPSFVDPVVALNANCRRNIPNFTPDDSRWAGATFKMQ